MMILKLFGLILMETDILSTTLGEHHVQKLVTLKLNEKKIFKKNRHDYFDSYPTLHCNLDHIS